MTRVSALQSNKNKYEIFLVTSRYYGDIFLITKNGGAFASEKTYDKSVNRVGHDIKKSRPLQ